MVEKQDIHELSLDQWGEIDSALVGSVVEVRILCVHAFGVGVRLQSSEAYGHVNPPQVTDGRFTVENEVESIGELRKAVILDATPGRQPRLTLRLSKVNSLAFGGDPSL